MKFWSNALSAAIYGRKRLNHLWVGDTMTIVAADSGHVFRIRKNEEILTPIVSLKKKVVQVALQDDETLMAAGLHDGVIVLVSTESNKQVAELRAHTDEITALAFDRSSGMLYSASRDGLVRAWQSTDGSWQEAFSLQHGGAVLSMQLSPNGERLAVVVHDERAVSVWSLPDLYTAWEKLGIGLTE